MTSIILGIIGIAVAEAAYKKVDIFEEFLNGVKEGMQLLKTVFPTIMAFMLWVTCFQTCGITGILEQLFNPMLTFLRVPIDIIMMMFIRPFSSNGSMSIMSTIYNKYGIDHTYSLLASIIQTGSDTTFYVVTLYFGSIKITNYRYALTLGLWLDFIACVLALICYHLWIV